MKKLKPSTIKKINGVIAEIEGYKPCEFNLRGVFSDPKTGEWTTEIPNYFGDLSKSDRLYLHMNGQQALQFGHYIAIYLENLDGTELAVRMKSQDKVKIALAVAASLSSEQICEYFVRTMKGDQFWGELVKENEND